MATGGCCAKSPDAPEVTAIVEQKALEPEQQGVREINSGIYGFERKSLFAHIGQLRADNLHQELYLTDMARILHDAGERVVAIEAAQPEEVLGANTIAEMAKLDRELRMATADRLMVDGVTIQRPETVMIDARRGGGAGHGDRTVRAVTGRDAGGERLPDPVVCGAREHDAGGSGDDPALMRD